MREREKEMVSRKHKKAAMYRKLRLLRSVTNSHATKASIVLDSFKYVKQMNPKPERENEDVAGAQDSSTQIPFRMIKVEPLDKGFLVEVLSERSCTGLLVFILEAFEALGMDVLHARVSCSDNFHLEAVGRFFDVYKENEGQNAQGVKQAVLQAINNWRESSEEE